MAEKLKTISITNTSSFDAMVNEFTSKSDIVVTNFNFSVSSQAKRTVYTAFIFYMDKQEYIDIKRKEAELKMAQQNLNKPVSKPRKPRKTTPKKEITKKAPTDISEPVNA